MEAQVITGEENIARFRLCALKGALKMEVLGMRHSKVCVSKIVKGILAEAGIKGKSRKADLLAQFEAYIASL